MKVADLIKQLETLQPDAKIEFSTACVEPGVYRVEDIYLVRDTIKEVFVLELVMDPKSTEEWINRAMS